MNDFTLDELALILLEMNIVIQRTTMQGILTISPMYFELRDKIQDMIKNNCEHEFEIEYSPYLACHKCQEKR